TSLNGLLHHVIHVRNKQTDNSSYPICTFRLQRSKVAHGFMQMKNRSVDVQLCNMNAAVIISKTKVFRRTELCIEVNVARVVWNVEFGGEMSGAECCCHN